MKPSYTEFGIITSLDADQKTAKVYIPLYKIETDYIPICRTIPIMEVDKTGIEIKSEVVVTFINGDLREGIVTSWI